MTQSGGRTKLSIRYLPLGFKPKRIRAAVIAATPATPKSAINTSRTYVRIQAPGRLATQPTRSPTATIEEESDTPHPTPHVPQRLPPWSTGFPRRYLFPIG